MYLHSQNETMRIIRHNGVGIILENENIGKDLNNILKAHREKDTTYLSTVAMDAFLLGYMYGKRAELARKKARMQQEETKDSGSAAGFYRKEIIKEISGLDNIWILQQILQAIKNIQR